MKTLLIISHPSISESGSQQFLLGAISDRTNVTIHHLETAYPKNQINVTREIQLLKEHDRIIFQFPFYWYSAPATLKKWQDTVLSSPGMTNFGRSILADKEFGLVPIIGVKESEYTAGGREGFTLDYLTAPYQAMARKLGMLFLPSFAVFQFDFLTEDQRKSLIIDYLLYTTGKKTPNFSERTDWLLQELAMTDLATLPKGSEELLEHIKTRIKENQETLEELRDTLEEF